MTRRKARHVHRKLTPEESARVAEARRLIAGEKDDIHRKAREYKQAYDAGQAALEQALQLLESERQRQGLSTVPTNFVAEFTRRVERVGWREWRAGMWQGLCRRTLESIGTDGRLDSTRR